MTWDMARRLADAGYAVYPASVRLDERGKKKPSIPGSWAEGSGWHPNNADFLGVGGLVIDTGKSNIVVVDVDEHGDHSGSAALAAAGIALPETPMRVRTWSGGEHRFFRQPEVRVGCAQNVPVPNIDLRGDGGIVFGPSTVVTDDTGASAGEYELLAGIIPVSLLPVLSIEFQEAVAASQRRPERPERQPRAPRSQNPAKPASDHQRAVLNVWLAEDLEAIAAAGDGERHGVLLSHAAKVIDRGQKLGLTPETVEGLVYDAYRQSGGTEWEEKRLIVDWAFERLEEDPMDLPEDFVDPDSVRFEEAVRTEVTRGRIKVEARKRLAQDNDPVDLGRELDFDEPPGGLFGQAWVDGVLPKGETVLLFGERNVGKSFVAVDLGLSVASGRPWHGKNTEVGNVLYLAGEGAIGLPSRRRSWVQHHRTTAPAAFSLRDAIVHLTNPASMAAWQKVISESAIDLVIVDTVRRAGRGLEMESPGDAQELIALLDDLRAGRHGCTVLALGHPTKSDPLQPAGAGTVQDALPMIHRLSRDGEGDATIVDMTTTKSKDGPTGLVASFVHRRVGDSLVFVDKPGTAVVTSGDPFDSERRRREEGW